MNILEAIDDQQVFASAFRDPESWTAWRAFLASLFGLPMDAKARRIFRECTGRKAPNKGGYLEAWLVCGRRAGKSFILALTAVFLACFRDWRPYLGPGEVGTIMVIAAEKRQCRAIMRFVRGLLKASPMLAATVENETAQSVTLRNRIVIEVHVASYRTVRGYTCPVVLLDEVAIWPADDCAEPDHEVLEALRPCMATVPGAVLLCASSPYAKRGVLWDAHRRHYAKEGDPVLVWQAAARTMNETVPQRVIADALERDQVKAQADWLAIFRSDSEAFVSREAVDAVVDVGVRERAPEKDVRYFGFVDPSGGGGTDSMTLAISHRAGDVAVLDLVRERKPPFSPEAVVGEFAEDLRRYRISTVQGDRFGGTWPQEGFAKRGVTYQFSPRSKSDIYRNLLPELNSGHVRLLDHPRLIAQLCGLERRVGRAGKDSIDHADHAHAHDDVCNAACGALIECGGAVSPYTRGLMENVRPRTPKWTNAERLMRTLHGPQ